MPLDRAAYDSLLKSMRPDAYLEALQRWVEDVKHLAEEHSVSLYNVEKHTLLHMPALADDEISGSGTMPLQLKRALNLRLSKYAIKHSEHIRKARIGLIADGASIYHKKIRLDRKGEFIDVDCKEVTNGIAAEIEGYLHYMQVPRTPFFQRSGLFVAGAVAPFYYANICKCDRIYIQSALSEHTGEIIDRNEIFILSRMYGLTGAPKNSASFMIRHILNYLRTCGGEFLVTAINPMLRFSGVSMRASGFDAFAISPIHYSYDSMGQYQTRRLAAEHADPADRGAPPNLLLVRGITHRASRRLAKSGPLVRVTQEAHKKVGLTRSESILDQLIGIRKELQKAWSTETRYQKLLYKRSDPVSKGQCGVTSAYLARKLASQGVGVLFCEGDVFFSKEVPPIRQHCWLRIPRDEARKILSNEIEIDDDIIVDLTADQTGYVEPIIVESVSRLGEIGIRYEERSNIKEDELGVIHLIKRLSILENQLGSDKKWEETLEH